MFKFKPGDLIISTGHMCNALGSWDPETRKYTDLGSHYNGCIERGTVGMIVAVLTEPICYYRVLFGDKMMNIYFSRPHMKKMKA